jgi:hypothetical protein
MNVDILLPNLHLSAPAIAALPKSATADPPALAALLKMAHKAEQTTATSGSFPWLLNAFGMPQNASHSGISSLFSSAEVAAYRLKPPAADNIWLVAEPVYLKPDRDALALFRGAHLEITNEDAAALITTLNQHFAQDGLLFAAATASRWYVQCPLNRAPSASSPSWVAARGELFTHMPKSMADGLNWRAILNEAQMLLFNHPINEKREVLGRLPINGVWIFGGAKIDAVALPPPYQTVYSTNFEALALAECFKLSCEDMPSDWTSVKFSANNIITINALESIAVEEDFSQWQYVRNALDSSIFNPFLQKIQRGEIGTLRLIDAHSPITKISTITSFSLKRFFKRLVGSN